MARCENSNVAPENCQVVNENAEAGSQNCVNGENTEPRCEAGSQSCDTRPMCQEGACAEPATQGAECSTRVWTENGEKHETFERTD